MHKRMWRIGLTAVGLIGVVVLVVVVLVDFFAPHIQELSARKARRVFEVVADRALPGKTDNLRAIYWHQREPRIFVRFTTNADGLAYVLKTFAAPPLELDESKTLDADMLKGMKAAGFEVFIGLPQAEEELGVHLFDLASVSPGSELVEDWDPDKRIGYRMIIDHQTNTAYLSAMQT